MILFSFTCTVISFTSSGVVPSLAATVTTAVPSANPVIFTPSSVSSAFAYSPPDLIEGSKVLHFAPSGLAVTFTFTSLFLYTVTLSSSIVMLSNGTVTDTGIVADLPSTVTVIVASPFPTAGKRPLQTESLQYVLQICRFYLKRQRI